jgi:CheY-like chemotaxis protein
VRASQRILLVDDDEGIREFVSLALTDEGFAVDSVANGEAALEAVADAAPDLILLDTRMPVMNGPEFVEAYRRRPGPHAPIVLLTAASDAEDLARQVAPDALLAKPFDLDDLLDLVGRLIGNAE